MARSYVFVGGGSGGHLYPALAIIEQLRAIDPSARVHIVSSDKPIDAQILKDSGVAHTTIPARPPVVRPAALLRFLAAWRPSVQGIRRVIRPLGADTHVVSMGGYVAAPASAAAQKEGRPLTLVNLDAVPGRANRWIASRATRCVTAAPIEGFEHWTRVRPVVRAELLVERDRSEARRTLGLDPDTPTLLVTGGSQGAQSLNRFIQRFTAQHTDLLDDWQILHQCGAGADPARLTHAYTSRGVNARAVTYIDDMPSALAAADLTLARCGAGNVAECWATRTPALFMPYPFHADDHQRRNAQVLVDAGAAIVRTDHVDPAANIDDAGAALRDLLLDPQRLAPMREALASLDPPDGAATIARLLAS